ncbi:Ask1p KNAG_0A07280 [Huiozyma naganishii CBS 8797]|uniref:DASH complex subunit ASK1 n=1 Tax=Huiozyma naganishii (strain ATCC MYA-139 / BCRC 22969 / CBS 8797 / KCTC 17520 / NBRC 10181 / NCYC 3082 / Yp74L-3) TaxID=1071383 RepID=J7S445_HUIN7|nr:hypothetical protein KNAG_0A07280 [Kazachstania naganishii CBS 8797]CCK68381.1 hypothetical protein KNAG_0A07280 [Kazachstania naganishii CBS 8797]
MHATVEELDQEIVAELQRIDANFGHCFARLTRDVIPRVRRYGELLDEVLQGTRWLAELFQHTAEVNLLGPGEDTSGAPVAGGGTSIFPEDAPNTTSTGQILQFPDSSDDEAERVAPPPSASTEDDDAGGSTLQRQSKKRKISLLLQQEYASSSSAVPSPQRGSSHRHPRGEDDGDALFSSPDTLRFPTK